MQIKTIEQKLIGEKKDTLPSFGSGDTIQVHFKITEGDKERIQVFEGLVIKKQRSGASSTFTVRKVSYGVGVERIFPLYSPKIEKIKVLGQGKVRRGKLYYLRNLQGRNARIKETEQQQKAE